MTLKEHIHQLVDSLDDDDDRLQVAEQVLELEPNGAGGSDDDEEPVDDDDGNSNASEPQKVGRLSFFGIGEGDPPDASERVDELVGLAIDRRHPTS
jgi:hypothetical protein